MNASSSSNNYHMNYMNDFELFQVNTIMMTGGSVIDQGTHNDFSSSSSWLMMSAQITNATIVALTTATTTGAAAEQQQAQEKHASSCHTTFWSRWGNMVTKPKEENKTTRQHNTQFWQSINYSRRNDTNYNSYTTKPTQEGKPFRTPRKNKKM